MKDYIKAHPTLVEDLRIAADLLAGRRPIVAHSLAMLADAIQGDDALEVDASEESYVASAMLFDLWNDVHALTTIYDFDSTQSAEELVRDLREILKGERGGGASGTYRLPTGTARSAPPPAKTGKRRSRAPRQARGTAPCSRSQSPWSASP